MIKRFFSHTLIYGISPQLTKIASFLALPIITKDLTAVDYGVSGIITAYVTGISAFATLGLRIVLVNSFFKSPNHYKWLWRQIYGFLTIWNFIYAIILAILLYLIVPAEAMVNRNLIILLNVSPLVFFGQTQTIGSTFYQINQNPMQIAMRSVIFGLLTIVLNIYLISYQKMGYMGWFWATFLAGILHNFSYYYSLNYSLRITPIFNYKWRIIRQSLKTSLPTVPHNYSTYLLGNSDRMIMDLIHINTAHIGSYNLATLLGTPASQLASATTQAIGPLLNSCYKKSQDVVARDLIFFWQGAFIIGTLLLSIWLKEIVAIFIQNQNMQNVYQIGVILIMAFNYRPMYAGANAKLFYAEKTKVLWRVSFIAGITNIAMNIVAIPIWGVQAAAYTTFISYMYMGYSGFYFKVFKEVNSVKYYPELWLTLTVLVTILAIYLVDQGVMLKMFTSFVVLVGMFFLVIKLRKKGISFF